MSDERLNILEQTVAEPAAGYGPVRINRIKISNYRFFRDDFEIAFGGENLLVYGENGSGKSTIYKALEYLTKRRFDSIAAEKNIFSEEGEPLIEFDFNNGKELIIHSDLTELPAGFDFITDLFVFTPMLDYKKLLKVHYTPVSADRINVYDMLRGLFSGYEVEDGLALADIREPTKYFDALTQIVNKVLLDETNKILALFDHDISIEKFSFKTEFTSDNRLEPVINIEVNYRDQQIDSYHVFLNEARLSALAVALYFAAIKSLLGALKGEPLKILVLDDLLISLDMSNRMKLLDILKAEFNDFQIFFFTHDKELFEIYKHRMVWEKFELYVDDAALVPAAKVIKSASELERARKYFDEKEYDSCALQLRKGCENLLKSYLPPKERLNRNGEELDFSGMLDKAKSKNADLRTLLERLDSDRTYILNRLCHDDHGKVYSGELKNAVLALETLEGLLK